MYIHRDKCNRVLIIRTSSDLHVSVYLVANYLTLITSWGRLLAKGDRASKLKN